MPPRKSPASRLQPAAGEDAAPAPRPAGRDLVNPMDRFVGYKIRRIKQAVIGELNDILRPHELRIMDFATLCIVEANPGLYQNEITRLLGAEPPAVVLSLDRLEKGGYLIRRLSENDRRLRTLHLTPSGRQLQKKVNVKVEQQERQIKLAVHGDLAAFVAALDDLMRYYDLD
ncbi:MarR family winged helix-turn-helix transcriptional regulator [Bradyrhizobium sp. 2TAF24]|uniref:MarR family winged helix-turn-helix transcriptional regulator n=1 Tax=Bradyrhizobium sp. 2TAF24 TaxID=3233011 RepID=UPI003F92DD38